MKTDKLGERFGREDLMAAWVADMDFATPPFIIEALRKRLEHPIFGYCVEPDEYRQLIISWEKDLHGLDLDPDWISYIPGIVKGIGFVINVFTKPGDDIFIMPPVYHPFRITAELNNRNVVKVPLKEKDGEYNIDFDLLCSLETKGGVLILSNPHNPGGKMWSKEDLSRLAEICDSKKILVISDEIHADMALWGKKHIPFIKAADIASNNSIRWITWFTISCIPFVVCLIVAIAFGSIMSSRLDGLYAVITIVTASLAGLFFIFCLFTAHKMWDALKKVSLNEKNSSTKLGREYEATHAEVEKLKAILGSFKETE